MDSPIVSKAPFITLVGLWVTVGILCVICGAILFGLLFHKQMKDDRKKVHLQQKQDMRQYLITRLNMENPTVDDQTIKRHGGHPILVECAIEMLSQLRGNTHIAITRILSEQGVIVEQIRLLQQGTHQEKMRVIALFASLQDDNSLYQLRALLPTPDMTLRILVIEALGQRGDIVSLPNIIDVLSQGGIVASNRLSNVFRKFGYDAIPYLCDVVQKDSFMPLRIAALVALSHLKDDAVLKTLLQLTSHDNQNLRAQAFVALARMEDPRAACVVEAGLKDPAWMVRLQSAVLAGKLKLAERIPELVTLLNDPEWWVRLRAAEALRDLGEAGMAALQEIRATPQEAGTIAGLILDETSGTPS